MKLNHKCIASKTVSMAFLVILPLLLFSQVGEKQAPESYRVWEKPGAGGKEIVAYSTPVAPPKDFKMPVAQPGESAVLLSNVPAYDWSFGCSPTAAAMMAGYYDNNGYPSVYTGTTNGGVAPMDNSVWGSAWINGYEQKLCPLSATRQGLDGRSTPGHVDDYWVVGGHTGPDPYVTNGWTQHPYDDCTGDFMKTNQAAFNNSDGSTTFVYFTDGSPFGEPAESDGCYGLKLFFESRNCPVMNFYNQYIYGFNGNTKGFTFSQYCDMIDRGRPVLIQVSGHTMLGMGYDASTQKVYLHDTWDYSMHEMTWGDSYAAMQHYGVGVIEFPCNAVEALSEDFTYFCFPACWQQSSGGAFNWNRWYLSYSNAAGGSPNEMQIFWTEGIGVARLISAPIDLSGIASVDLSFMTDYDDWGPGATLKIQSSADLVNWTDEGWTYPTGSGEIPSGTIITASITHNLTSHTYIAWVVDGNHYQITSWSVDNVSLVPSIAVSLKTYLQGPFNGVTMNTSLNPSYIPLAQPYNVSPWNYSGTENVPVIPNVSVVDWVLVELRETSGDAYTATSGTMIGRKAGFILSNGTITATDGSGPLRFNNTITQNLFVVVHHRSHSSIMSADPVTQSAGIYTYDYTTASNKIFGGAEGSTQLATGIWGMMGGNGSADGITDNKDKNDAWNPGLGTAGYSSADFDMNGIVNLADKTGIWKSVAGKGTRVP